jgi:MoaA/NifB/PqqE/SkfB family radical SAM enzyme
MTERKRGLWKRLGGAIDRLLGPGPDDAIEAPGLPAGRRWRLLQVESAIACNIDCVMCPWHGVGRLDRHQGRMTEEVWRSIAPHLDEVAEIDFSGGGEPLLQPRLAAWIAEAHEAGCRTGFLTNALLLSPDTARELVDAGVDWIATSIDGASAETYETVRRGSSFERVVENLEALAEIEEDGRPERLVNFVMMPLNRHELLDMVRLSARLGIARLNFKQVDVIRGEHGKGYGLYGARETAAIRELRREVAEAERLARSLGVRATAFPFTPEERPVCEQDPRTSLFVRCDGLVSACISLAYGGPTTFFGEAAEMPTVEFGRLPDDDLLAIWEGETCRRYRERFEERARILDARMSEAVAAKSPAALEKARRRAVEAMPEACEGCRTCHYLFGV